MQNYDRLTDSEVQILELPEQQQIFLFNYYVLHINILLERTHLSSSLFLTLLLKIYFYTLTYSDVLYSIFTVHICYSGSDIQHVLKVFAAFLNYGVKLYL